MERPVDPAYSLYEGGTAILPKEEVEKKGDAFGAEPVGLGPFKFAKWVKGSEVVIAEEPGLLREGEALPGQGRVQDHARGRRARRCLPGQGAGRDRGRVGAVPGVQGRSRRSPRTWSRWPSCSPA